MSKSTVLGGLEELMQHKIVIIFRIFSLRLDAKEEAICVHIV